jgi:hypothetical protein
MFRNPKLIATLPTGFTLTATTQVAGRGRGTNVWLAPAGCLIMSTIINHAAYLASSRPIVFIQYLAAIATVEAIQSYGPGCQKLPVKLKWPNDICRKKTFFCFVVMYTLYPSLIQVTSRCTRSRKFLRQPTICQIGRHPGKLLLLSRNIPDCPRNRHKHHKLETNHQPQCIITTGRTSLPHRAPCCADPHSSRGPIQDLCPQRIQSRAGDQVLPALAALGADCDTRG